MIISIEFPMTQRKKLIFANRKCFEMLLTINFTAVKTFSATFHAFLQPHRNFAQRGVNLGKATI